MLNIAVGVVGLFDEAVSVAKNIGTDDQLFSYSIGKYLESIRVCGFDGIVVK